MSNELQLAETGGAIRRDGWLLASIKSSLQRRCVLALLALQVHDYLGMFPPLLGPRTLQSLPLQYA